MTKAGGPQDKDTRNLALALSFLTCGPMSTHSAKLFPSHPKLLKGRTWALSALTLLASQVRETREQHTLSGEARTVSSSVSVGPTVCHKHPGSHGQV